MKTTEARTAVEAFGLQAGTVQRIAGGWAYHTFLVDDCWIFRFPQRESVAESLRQEIDALPRLARHVPFEMPQFRFVAASGAPPCVGYRRIHGRALAKADLNGPGLHSVAKALRSLHQVPTAIIPGTENGGIEGWRSEFEGLRARATEDLGGRCGQRVLDAVERGFDGYLTAELNDLAAGCVVHRDLGPEHILMSDDGARLAGIIDFEDLAIGDPAIDFVGIGILAGVETVERMLPFYGLPHDGSFFPRVRFYMWMGSYHAVHYGIQIADEAFVDEAIVEMRRRLAIAGLLA